MLPLHCQVLHIHLFLFVLVLLIVFFGCCVYATLLVSAVCAGFVRHSVICMCSVCPWPISRCLIFYIVIILRYLCIPQYLEEVNPPPILSLQLELIVQSDCIQLRILSCSWSTHTSHIHGRVLFVVYPAICCI